MFKPSLGLGTKLGAAANKPDLNVRFYVPFISIFFKSMCHSSLYE